MKKAILAILALALLLPTLAVADTYQPGDNIYLDTGVPYGNYGYQGLVALYDGDMDAVDGHMRSAHSNQQGGGEGGVRGSVVKYAPVKMTYEEMVAYLMAGELKGYRIIDTLSGSSVAGGEKASFVGGIWDDVSARKYSGYSKGSVAFNASYQFIISIEKDVMISYDCDKGVTTLTEFINAFRDVEGVTVWYPY